MGEFASRLEDCGYFARERQKGLIVEQSCCSCTLLWERDFPCSKDARGEIAGRSEAGRSGDGNLNSHLAFGL